VRLGLVLPPTAADVPATARRAEEQGFDLVASGEHVLFGSPTPNAFVTLAAAASVTSRLRLLSAVTLLPLYPAPLAAKMAATLDRVSGGRFELGVGVGGENPVEFAACGVPVHERGRRTDAALDVVVRLFAGEAIDVDGTPARLDPLPLQRPRPPVWVGGRSEASMRRAGRAGDVWMPYLGSPDRVARGLRTAREEAERHGRDPAEVTGAYFAWTAIDPDPAVARRRALDVLRATYGQDMERIVDACVPHGTPEQVAARLAEYRDAGAESVVIAPATDHAERDVGLLAREVLPRLR
jgi:probable F420-dependent oxidoreductase